jgi:hypothetical protein
MSESPIDTLARQAGASRDRRTSLKALGATLLVAAVAAPRGAAAGSSSKKAKKAVKKACGKQVDACKSGWTSACGDSEVCQQLAGCCDSLKTCDAAGQVKCMTDIL